MGDEVEVLEDDIQAYDDGTVVRIRILDVPDSDQYPEGVKYAFHYGEAGADEPIIRFDNHHGPHELHIAGQVFEIEYEGLQPLYEAWRAGLPAEKRIEW